MKKIIFILFLFGLVVSCSSDENIELIGKWKLIEYLRDPGDGSGTFQKADFDQTIDFFLDNTVLISTSPWCDINVDVPGNYSIEESKIYIECTGFTLEIDFYMQGSKLILAYPTSEPWKDKYSKVN